MKRLAYLPLPANQPRSNGRRPHDPSPPPPAPHPSSPATAMCLSLEPVEHPPPPSPAAQHAALPPRHAPSKCPAGHVPVLAKSFTCTPCPWPPCDADSTSRAGPVSLRSFPSRPCLTSPPSLRLPHLPRGSCITPKFSAQALPHQPPFPPTPSPGKPDD